MTEQSGPQQQFQQPKPSSAVTALSVLVLVFGILGLLGSFIPCFGMYAIYISVPTALIGIVTVITAKRVNAPRGLAVAGLVIALIASGIAIAQLDIVSSIPRDVKLGSGSDGGGESAQGRASADRTGEDIPFYQPLSAKDREREAVPDRVPRQGETTLVIRVRTPTHAVPANAEAGFIHNGKLTLAPVDRQGRTQFHDVPAGKLTLVARAPGYWEDWQDCRVLDGVPTQIVLLLNPVDWSDPAEAGKALGIEVRPGELPASAQPDAGESSTGTAFAAVWPRKDVRAGLDLVCAVEVPDAYAGDAWLEFRVGRKILSREQIPAEKGVIVSRVPAEVAGELEPGRRVRWGITDAHGKWHGTQFKVVKAAKYERKADSVQRTPQWKELEKSVQGSLTAHLLLNYRLYAESMVHFLIVATQSEGGRRAEALASALTCARRLDLDGTRLWYLLSEASTTGTGERLSRLLASIKEYVPTSTGR